MNSIALLEPQQRNINTALRLLSDRMRCTLLLTDRYLERRGAAAWPVSNQWDYPALLADAAKAEDSIKGTADNGIGRPQLQTVGYTRSVKDPSRDAPAGRWTSLTKWILKGCSKQ